ncbi:MAG: dihydropteroate synthase [Acidimicrobiia bacterium]
MSAWRLADRSIELDHPVIMGVLNVTPDSFSDGGAFFGIDSALERAARLVADGAEIIDIGGESTRPGADPVSADVEISRVAPIIEQVSRTGVVVSVDTMKPEVARAAVEAGARIINDVTGFVNPAMRRVAADTGVGVVIMHMQGSPRTMQLDPHYDDVVTEVCDHLAARAALCVLDGVASSSICVDPGIGFGKTVEHNLALLDRLDRLVALGYPVMLGASRKSFLGRILGIEEPELRDGATAVTTALGVDRGAMVFRVHDPARSREAAALAWAIVESRVLRRHPGMT